VEAAGVSQSQPSTTHKNPEYKKEVFAGGDENNTKTKFIADKA